MVLSKFESQLFHNVSNHFLGKIKPSVFKFLRGEMLSSIYKHILWKLVVGGRCVCVCVPPAVLLSVRTEVTSTQDCPFFSSDMFEGMRSMPKHWDDQWK